MLSFLPSFIKKKKPTASDDMENSHPICPSDTPGVNGLNASEQQLHTEHYQPEYYDIDAVCAEAYDLLGDEMMDIEGVLDEEIWEARVMSDPIIVFADLVSPGEEEVWAELEKQKDEEQKDIDGYERLLQMELEEVEAARVEISTESYLGPWDEDLIEVGQAWAESNCRCQYEFDSMLLADEFLAEELREQEDHVKEVEKQQKGWDMNTSFPEEDVWNDLRIDMELEVQENEEKLK
ncbi:hypothetical protein BG003_000773 [Podila horticola]|nr:hypothetical protein BG003_000773 [Podila horticola]